ncbi:MAG: hypothetical protein A2W99_00430 [Bacteroidetes bacterium GWF2_33_16]|nr:MAG: hypothetical protein A2X00_03135 [Bacteroidetes bacterium GWE2_32_14]OFY08739.1 MAG: hypothetical protein A2W99_00430 [Bacteroidetes bacterium GWF2_33_16]
MKKLLLIISLLLINYIANAQLSINAEYRPRFELRDGYSTLKTDDSEPAYFTTQRTRLYLRHTYNTVTSNLSIQDYRIWGDSKFKSDDPGLSIYEAWFKLDLSSRWSLSAGRQSFDIDNKRLFSKANWNQVSLSHDGLNIDFMNENFQLKIFTAFNQAKVSNFGTDYSAQISNYKFLNVIWLEKKLGNISMANLTITDGFQKEGTTNTDYYRVTSGLIFKYKVPKGNLQLRGFYQTGKNKTGQDINAYFVSTDYEQKIGNSFQSSLGFELMSGNDLSDTLNMDDNAFDILYGSGHAFNGMMDYFSTPKTTSNAGLVDVHLKNQAIIKDWSFSLNYYYFALASYYVYEGKKQSKFLANEIDFIANYKVNDIINLELGYGMLFAGKTLEYIKGGYTNGIQQFFYTMITVKPVFFKN